MAASMLPWRRSKVVLAPAEPAGRAKSPWAPPLAAAALLAGLLRRRAEPWRPLQRLAAALGRRRRSVQLSTAAPTYTVRYLGHAATLRAQGAGCTEEPLGRICARAGAGSDGAKMTLTLGPRGLRLAPREPGAAAQAYALGRITHCGAGGAGRPHVFAWVYRHAVGKRKAVALRCHAALAPTARAAGAMASRLRQACADAGDERRRLRRQRDGRRQRLLRLGARAVPAEPLRRLLKAGGGAAGTALHGPPRGGSRLGSILEEEEEEDGEDGQGGGSVLRLAGELRGCSLRAAAPRC